MGFYSGVLKTLLESFTCVDVITWSGDHPERPSQRGFPGTYILSLTLCLLINNDFSGFSNFLILLKIYIFYQSFVNLILPRRYFGLYPSLTPPGLLLTPPKVCLYFCCCCNNSPRPMHAAYVLADEGSSTRAQRSIYPNSAS